MIWGTPPETMEDVVREVRHSMVQAIGDANNARTKKDRAAAFSMAYAYASTLSMMQRVLSPWPEGIASKERFMGGEVGKTLEFLSGDDKDLLGQKEVTV